VDPLFYDLNLLGVPFGWKAWATRVYADQLSMAEHEFEMACARANTRDILFLAYGGRETMGAIIRERGWIWIPEDSVEVRKDG